MVISSSILPQEHVFAKKSNVKHTLHLEAICVFVATGFFMDEDTYWKDLVCLAPAHDHEFDSNGRLIKSSPNFQWHYTPRKISFDQALEEYVALLTQVLKEQTNGREVILPLSGGLDSRSQALVLKKLTNPVHAFSYSFQNGYPEHQIAKQVASVCGFDFKEFIIKQGYLWNCIKDLATINGCYSEFTHPRQMAVLDELKQVQGVFSLGHWGDVLFDRGVPEGINESEIVSFVFKKMVKPKGLELAQCLWEHWGLDGDFKSYLIARIETGLKKIKIDNISAKVRAFKTIQWGHRWTTTNLSIFKEAHPISMPYYDNRMCEFICSIPEAYLADRRLQIGHLRQDKTIANITWQAQRPFNINNYSINKMPFNLPYRVLSKFKRLGQGFLGHPYVQRNWELQFLGENNEECLKDFLYNEKFNEWIPRAIIEDFYNRFRKVNAIPYSHPVSMLLTLSVWYQRNFKGN
ncbi:asparagine synthase-related protein [Mangrovimonas futianensis]|uniref:asparagine synthase-related protein n=1 Tax=Mangrovimonas futianensis TaxID=2895523 RepID=UPI001E2E562E|nr:asparagine synthase-related protein [Mangrovimonas futianensis]MCF1421402.1 asparagine synthase-related protein [Mangrovimonas futianensis]